MNVLYISDQYSKGGAADALVEMIRIGKGYGIEASVLTGHRNEAGERLSNQGIEYVFCGYRQFAYAKPKAGKWKYIKKFFMPLYSVGYRYANQRALDIVKDKIDFERIDVIHSNVDRNDFGAVLAKRYGVPHIWHLRECPSGHFDLGFYRRDPATYMNHNATSFIAISEYVKEEWVRFGLDEKKISVIYDGVDLSGIEPRQGSGTDGDKLKLVCVGEITVPKGQHIIIEALNRLSDSGINIELDFWGNGNAAYINSLREKCPSNANMSVDFCGYSNSLQTKLKDYDIGINPSTNEGFGRTTVEYMAAGLCTLALNDGGNKELIIPGHNGLCFNDSVELADMLQMLYKNKEERRRLAESGQMWAKGKMDMNRNIRKIVRIYEEACSKKH